MALTITLKSGHTFALTEDVTTTKLNKMFELGFGIVVSGGVGTGNIEAEAVTVNEMADLSRGSILSGQTAANRPAALDCKTAGQILLGDGTDVISIAMSGDATITAGGVITVANQLTIATQWDADGVNFPEKGVPVDNDWVLLEDSENAYAKRKMRYSSFSANFPPSWKHNLVVKNNAATPDSEIDIDADELVAQNVAGSRALLESVNVTIDTTVTGANGLDTGSLANTTLYYIWVIYNATTATVAGLASTSASSPTMPSGYEHKRLVGEVATNGTADFIKHRRVDDQVWLEDPEVIYSNQTLTTTYVLHNTPLSIPAGATELKLEGSTTASATPLKQVISPDSTTRFEVTLDNVNTYGAATNKGPTAGYQSQQLSLNHLGATSIYARSNNSSSYTGQNLHAWGYTLAR